MVISRVIIRVAPFRALVTLLVTCLLSPLPLQVEVWGFGVLLRYQYETLNFTPQTLTRTLVVPLIRSIEKPLNDPRDRLRVPDGFH